MFCIECLLYFLLLQLLYFVLFLLVISKLMSFSFLGKKRFNCIVTTVISIFFIVKMSTASRLLNPCIKHYTQTKSQTEIGYNMHYYQKKERNKAL